MSLVTDQIFFKALHGDSELMEGIGGRLYNTAIPLPDADVLNAPVPYVIVSMNGGENDGQTKDDPYEGDGDIVNIGVEVAARTREELATLSTRIRTVIHDEFAWFLKYEELYDEGEVELDDSDEFQLWAASTAEEVAAAIPWDYDLTWSGVSYDSMKPCFWMTLNYRCDTER